MSNEEPFSTDVSIEAATTTAPPSISAVGLRAPAMMNIAGAHLLEREAIALARAGEDRRLVRIAGDTTPPPSTGLALSGGGIRSATFSLGVLQALARHEKLRSFDFLSTVSGGGYIGSWLSAWIYRKGLVTVEKQLASTGSKSGATADDPPTAAEPPEVAWLRRYSNYLSPRVGLTSVDSLTLLATWLRNVSLNAVIIFGFLVSLLLLPFEVLKFLTWSANIFIEAGFAAGIFGAFFFAGIAYNLWHQSITNRRDRNWILSTQGVAATVILPGYLACCTAAVWLFDSEPKGRAVVLFAGAYFAALLLLTFGAVFLAQQRLKPELSRLSPAASLVMLMAGLIAFFTSFGVLTFFHLDWLARLKADSPHMVLMMFVGPAALVFALASGTTIFTGMVGRLYYERSREWWSRLNAWLLMLAVCWVVWVALAFYSLPLLTWVFAKLGNWTALVGTGWVGSLLTATLFKKPEGGSKRLQANVDLLLNIAASVFVAGLLIVVSALVCRAVLALNDLSPPAAMPAASKAVYRVVGADGRLVYTVQPTDKAGPGFVELMTSQSAQLEKLTTPDKIAVVLSKAELKEARPSSTALPADVPASEVGAPFWAALQFAEQIFDMTDAMLIASVLLMLLFGWRVDINKFSLHNMYKNRLVRCYLGASNLASRNEQPFTGLDDADDLPLSLLNGGRRNGALAGAAGIEEPRPPQRPIHIINTTLNITQGKNLAWQERKAASFVFTPVVCGYALERTQGDSMTVDRDARAMSGYSETATYASNDKEEKGFTLGMALATSGAAVSPNMGSASARSRAFVLTLFNVRLGRWSPNPAKKAWRRPSPRFGLIPMLQELFGYSNEDRDFLYLSDGGHFENLGLYELVRRKCKTIFVVDAGADPGRAMGDLGEAVKKCRVDLGVEIEFPQLSLLKGDSDNRAQQGFMKGVIRYDLGDPSRDGVLVVIKPTMGIQQNEPADVSNYASLNPTFPQQTTADQFFDESQFESYRRLGDFIAEACLTEHGQLLKPYTETVFAPPKEKEPLDPPALSSVWIGKLLHREPPSREGCRVDMAVVLLAVVVALASIRLLVEAALFHAAALPCLIVSGCRDSLALLTPGDSPISTVFRVSLDCFFVALCTGASTLACVIAYQASRSASTPAKPPRIPARVSLAIAWVAFVCVGVAALLAIGEDFQILGWTQTDDDAELIGAARWAVGKSWAIAACVISIGLLSPWIWRDFKDRWAKAAWRRRPVGNKLADRILAAVLRPIDRFLA